MANLTAEIDIQKKDLERSRADLDQMYLELGEVAVAWHQAIGYQPSQEAYDKLVAVAHEKEEIDKRINTLKAAVNDMSDSDRKIEQTKISMKELDKRYSILISSLGAVAIETAAAGKLPQRLEKCLEPMREYEKRLEQCNQKISKGGPAFIVALHERHLENLKKNLDDVFTATGRRIYNSGDFRLVPGQRAKGILDEMEQIRFAKKNYKNEILDQKTMMDEAQGSLVSLGAFGEENRKLRELVSSQNLVMDRLSDRYTEYGRVLASGIPYWMDEQAPEELKKCCNQIIRQSRKLAQQNLALEHMMMERDVEIHNMQLSKLSDQMSHLNSQIQAIENQKSELQQKVDAELKAISDLRMKQSEIAEKANQL